MKWVVDTCVIIDILTGDAEFARPSALACDGFDTKRFTEICKAHGLQFTLEDGK